MFFGRESHVKHAGPRQARHHLHLGRQEGRRRPGADADDSVEQLAPTNRATPRPREPGVPAVLLSTTDSAKG